MQPALAMKKPQVAALYAALGGRASGNMKVVKISAHARVRYAGQGYELDVPFRAREDGAAIARRFRTLHARRYGFTLDRPIEIVAARAAAVGKPHKLTLGAKGAPTRSAKSPGRAGAVKPIRGPSVITLADATMVVARGWIARPLPVGGWMLERE